ncbi:MAG: amidohydrolase, partial [Desulfarculaceae bacterium]
MPIENPPEIILHNGVISTQADANPLAQAVALGRGCIIAVGGDEDIRYLAGPDTQIIDLAGRLVTPGFIDTHIHFYEWAFNRQGLKLDGLSCLEDLLDLVGRASRDRPQRQWIMGQGWNETDWAQPRMPTRDVLDQVAPDHPVILWRCDMHLAAANSTALRMAAIDAGTADPPEGRIERDGQGEPTGILRELAINLIRKAISPPSANHARQTFTDAMRALHRRGVTGIHDTRLMDDETGADSFRTFQSLDRDGALNLRTWVTLPGHKLEEIIDLGICTGFGGQRLRTGHVKFFSDGGMGARTAWMLDPFLDADRGMPLMDMAELARQVEKADRAGLSVMVHAVGDRANREVISIFEALKTRREKSNTPPPAIEHRIEHLQMIRPEDALRLGDLGVGLCVTPANLLLDINLIDTA